MDRMIYLKDAKPGDVVSMAGTTSKISSIYAVEAGITISRARLNVRDEWVPDQYGTNWSFDMRVRLLHREG